jgi:SAM-dependent methyltransferase
MRLREAAARIQRSLRRTVASPELRASVERRGSDDRDYYSEISFWSDYLIAPTGIFDSESRRAAFPRFLLPFLHQLNSAAGGPPRLLELGSGPVSLLAWGVDQEAVEVTAVDPLARTYEEMMKSYDYDYPVCPVEGCGEKLFDRFDRGEFDVAYTSNALDHTASPSACMKNLSGVVRPGGLICCEGFEREGSSSGWQGLHQHDLIASDGQLLCIDRQGREANLSSDLECIYEAVHPFTERGIWTHGYEYDPAGDYVWFQRPWYSMIFRVGRHMSE